MPALEFYEMIKGDKMTIEQELDELKRKIDIKQKQLDDVGLLLDKVI